MNYITFWGIVIAIDEQFIPVEIAHACDPELWVACKPRPGGLESLTADAELGDWWLMEIFKIRAWFTTADIDLPDDVGKEGVSRLYGVEDIVT